MVMEGIGGMVRGGWGMGIIGVEDEGGGVWNEGRLPSSSVWPCLLSPASPPLSISPPPPVAVPPPLLSPPPPPSLSCCHCDPGGESSSPSPPSSLDLFSFFHFILLFWNQILICRSVKQRAWAISIRRLLVRYRLKWNSFSSSNVW